MNEFVFFVAYAAALLREKGMNEFVFFVAYAAALICGSIHFFDDEGNAALWRLGAFIHYPIAFLFPELSILFWHSEFVTFCCGLGEIMYLEGLAAKIWAAWISSCIIAFVALCNVGPIDMPAVVCHGFLAWCLACKLLILCLRKKETPKGSHSASPRT